MWRSGGGEDAPRREPHGDDTGSRRGAGAAPATAPWQAAPAAAPWQAAPATAPWIDRETFRGIVAEAIDSIPEHLHRRIENAVVVVEDEPDAETIAGVGLDPAHDSLYGLYQGTPISERGASFGNALPDRIVIYYLPLTEDFRDVYHLRREIRRTVIHEIGHFFGLSDRELRGMGY